MAQGTSPAGEFSRAVETVQLRLGGARGGDDPLQQPVGRSEHTDAAGFPTADLVVFGHSHVTVLG